MSEDPLYPVYYKDKWWTEEECDDVFVAFHYNPDNICEYISEGVWVYPDGEMEDDS